MHPFVFLVAFAEGGTRLDETTNLMEIAGLLKVSLDHVTAFRNRDNTSGDAPYLKDICQKIRLPARLGSQVEGRI